jgi:hypothetical protein
MIALIFLLSASLTPALTAVEELGEVNVCTYESEEELYELWVLVEESIVKNAIAAEDAFHAMALTPHTPSTIRGLKDFGAEQLAVMHGSCFRGDCGAELDALALYAEDALRLARDSGG